MESVAKKFIWSEAYRPHTINDCVLSSSLLETFTDFIKNRQVPNLLLAGQAGVGKTTVAMALCETLGYDYIILNGSDEGRFLDTFRADVTNFASSVSMTSDRKCVIIDECENTTADVQKLCRGLFQEFANNCSFILTCNFKNQIIEPLHSRCSVIDFQFPTEERPAISMRMFKRLCGILDDNKIGYDKKAVAGLVNKFYPDFRRTINELQRCASSGSVDESALAVINHGSLDDMVKYIKDLNFKDMYTWVMTQPAINFAQMCRDLADVLRSQIDPGFVPLMYIMIADYQHKHVTAIDPQINIIAFLCALMSEIRWKLSYDTTS